VEEFNGERYKREKEGEKQKSALRKMLGPWRLEVKSGRRIKRNFMI
jgi:hypothetical protein